MGWLSDINNLLATGDAARVRIDGGLSYARWSSGRVFTAERCGAPYTPSSQRGRAKAIRIDYVEMFGSPVTALGVPGNH